MRRILRTLFLTMLLIGCGSPNAPPVGFLNETLHSTSDLWAIWTTAQNSVAKRVDMNPMQRFLYGAPANIRAGDARALAALPHQLRVAAESDVLSSVLFAATRDFRMRSAIGCGLRELGLAVLLPLSTLVDVCG